MQDEATPHKQVIVLKVGKKGTICLPRVFLEELGLREGDPVTVRLEDGQVIVTPVTDPMLLGAYREKWSHTTVDEFEKESEEEQRGWGD